MSLSPDPAEEAYWGRFRSELMLDPAATYLNNGSFGPSPKVVFEAVVGYMKQLQSQPMQQLLREFPPIVRASKEKLGAYVGVSADDFAMVMNLTIGMNMAVHGLDLAPGAEILSTDQEYGAVNNCWEYVGARKGWTMRRVTLPAPPEHPDQIVDPVAQAISPQTKILMFSHITTRTGLILPVKRLSALAREHGLISVIDGAHAPGMIPVNLREIDPDFYIGNCHKWLMAPMGSAFLYARPDMQERLQPSTIGWGLSRQTGTSYMHRLFESLGTRDLSPFAGVGAAVDFQRGIGIERIAARGRHVAAYLREGLRTRFPEARLLNASDPALSNSLTTFTLTSVKSDQVIQEFWDRYRIQIAGGRMEGSNETRIRISTHYYNTCHDVDRFLDALADYLAGQ
ncbi:MAG: aminotransferase class V-fold PLP-dependent enzyme [candidate division Zixibacteria bacterium]|nr:aminotransferase class V-fold PLP-dependent enzyme [candidate division Zixibacteria bacterium]